MRVIINDTYDTICDWVASYIKGKINSHDGTFVLGLPTGSTPIGVYQRLVKFYQNGEISFANTITFNMDEYIGLDKLHKQSYHYFMRTNFFDHIDIPEENINLLDGCVDNPELECSNYEDKIKASGGIDLFLCGMGQDGHLAFNEPGSSLSSRTRVKTLCHDTILANSRFFENIEMVPTSALTVGIGTIMDAKEILIMASGLQKAIAIKQCIEGSVSSMYTCSVVQQHPDAIVICDEDATAELTVKVSKYYKSIQQNIDIYGKTISKMKIKSTDRIMITSPHPDDDVIGMGGLLQLLPNKQNVKIVYMTNGNGGNIEKSPDRIKEALSAIKVLGYGLENIINAELPFYNDPDRTVTNHDHDKFSNLLNNFDPTMLFVCSDKDPNHTHDKCYNIIKNTLKTPNTLNKSLTHIFEYMGAWGQFNPKDKNIIRVNIPFDQYLNKILAIKLHISQDPPPVPGTDPRDFTERAIAYNKCPNEPNRYYEYFKYINIDSFVA